MAEICSFPASAPPRPSGPFRDPGEAAPPGAASASGDAALDAAARDWLSRQACVTEYWLDRLVGAGGDPRLVSVLHQHACFLREAAGEEA